MDYKGWTDMLNREFAGMLTETIAYLPKLLLAAGLMVLGWLVAKLLRTLSIRLLLGLDRLWHRVVSHGGLTPLHPHQAPAKIAGEILFWFVLLFFIAGAAAILGLGTFVTWLSKIATYIPILLTGLLIILAGVVISALIRDLITSTAVSAGIAQGDLLGRVAQTAILLTAVVIGVDQIGIDITFLSIIVGVVLAATFGGVALAFGSGARSYMGNVIAGRQLRHLYQPGDRLRIQDIEGTIVELTPTKVILDSEAGRIVVPARLFEEEITVLADREDGDGHQ
jgi:hypothetical protein